MSPPAPSQTENATAAIKFVQENEAKYGQVPLPSIMAFVNGNHNGGIGFGSKGGYGHHRPLDTYMVDNWDSHPVRSGFSMLCCALVCCDAKGSRTHTWSITEPHVQCTAGVLCFAV